MRLAVEQRGGVAGGLGLLLDDLPLGLQPVDVAGELLLRGALRGGPDDDAGVLGNDLLEDVLEPLPLGVRQLAADPRHRATGHVDQEPAGQVDLLGQPGALVADRVLGDLHQHLVTGLQRLLDRALLAGQVGGVPVDLTGVQDGVTALADVDERRLHAGQHVLDAAEVDVPGEGGRLGLRDVVLDEDVVLEDGDLRALAALADDHLAVHRLAPGEELGLGKDGRAPASGVPAVPATLALGLQAGGPGHPADVVITRRAAVAAGPLGTVVVVAVLAAVLAVAGAAAAPATAAAGARTGLGLVGVRVAVGGVVRVLGVLVIGVGVGLGFLAGLVVGVGGILAGAAPATPAPAPAAAPAGAGRALVGLLGVVALVGHVVGVDRLGGLCRVCLVSSRTAPRPAAGGAGSLLLAGVGGVLGVDDVRVRRLGGTTAAPTGHRGRVHRRCDEADEGGDGGGRGDRLHGVRVGGRGGPGGTPPRPGDAGRGLRGAELGAEPQGDRLGIRLRFGSHLGDGLGLLDGLGPLDGLGIVVTGLLGGPVPGGRSRGLRGRSHLLGGAGALGAGAVVGIGLVGVGVGVVGVGHEGSPPLCSRAPIAVDWRPRRSTGWAGRASALGVAGTARPAKSEVGHRAAVAAAGDRSAVGAAPGGAGCGVVLGAVWCSVRFLLSCGGAVVYGVRGRAALGGASPRAAVPLDVVEAAPPVTVPRRRSDRRVLPLAAGARRTVGTERIGHGPGVVEPALRLTHGPRGQRRAQVGDGSQGGQHVVWSYSGRHLPDDHVQYGTTCLLARGRAGHSDARVHVAEPVLGALGDGHDVAGEELLDRRPQVGEGHTG